MLKVNIVGIGPGNENSMTKEAVQAIEQSACLIGDKRVVAPFENMGKAILHSSSVKDIKNYLKNYGENRENYAKNSEVSILVSGDVGFYSLAKSFLDDDETIGEIKLICGISSLQYFCSKLKTSWDDVMTVSLHGRDSSILDKVMNNHKVFVLTGGKNTPADICKTLSEFGLDVQVSVGENLSYAEERITTDSAGNIAKMVFGPLSAMLIINHNPITDKVITHGLPDDLFIRGDVPMTKQEIRSISLSKLQLLSTDIIYDIGAGTGSVAIEIALQAANGTVYAIEKETDALELIKKNKEKFGTVNLIIIPSKAPDGIEDLPKPDKVFIGGNGGNLSSILDVVFGKNPDVRVVINAITLETLHDIVGYFRPKPEIDVEIVNITVSKAKKVGANNLMFGQNPVTIITAQRNVNSIK